MHRFLTLRFSCAAHALVNSVLEIVFWVVCSNDISLAPPAPTSVVQVKKEARGCCFSPEVALSRWRSLEVLGFWGLRSEVSRCFSLWALWVAGCRIYGMPSD